jgi:hypothetical protein
MKSLLKGAVREAPRNPSPLYPWSPTFGVVGSGVQAQGKGFRVQGLGFRVQGSGFRVQGSGFRVQGSGFRV